MHKLFVYTTLGFYAFAYYSDEINFLSYQRQKKERPKEINLNETCCDDNPAVNCCMCKKYETCMVRCLFIEPLEFFLYIDYRIYLTAVECVFLTLRNYQVNARSASEVDYPWIAKIIHSKRDEVPYMCTAVCIDQQIFITAGKCVYVLKIAFTTVKYQDSRLNPKAFVLPSNGSKQMYDDIGFIIVNEDFEGIWKTVELLDEKRTDKTFRWLSNMSQSNFDHRVIGYTRFKSDHSDMFWKRKYYLTQLDVNVNMRVCREILVYNQLIDAFAVPCYHSCTLAQFGGKEGTKGDPNCLNYHGSEGSAVIDLKTNKLFGIATWGAYFSKLELPVGIAIPNSDNFFEDHACALKIRDDTEFAPPGGYYQSLCDN